MKKMVTVFIVLAGFHIFLGMGPIKEFSPTYDEPVHLTAGYVYWRTGDFHCNGVDHPAFAKMWAALPLLWLKPLLPIQHPTWVKQDWAPKGEYPLADTFLYHNRVSADRMIYWGRVMQLILSCFLGLVVVIAAFFFGGAWPAIFAAVMWSFSPTILAAGTLITTDLAFALFFFGFFACLAHSKTLGMKILAGVFLGLCFASKYFALALLPSLLTVLIWEKWVEKKKFDWRLYAVAGATGLLTLGIVYRFSELGVFWNGLYQIFMRSQAGRSSFFWGHHGTQGWLLYFPVAFLIKTPIPLLIGLMVAGWAISKRKITFPGILWIPPLIFLGVASISKVQIGHRHLLAMYPFMFVLVACALNGWGARGRWLAIPLGLWLMIGTWRVRPDFVAYFNEFVGGPAQGHRYLTDSNIDWGQGLKKLSGELTEKEREAGIYLSYFGVADPHFYGIRYLDVGSDRIVTHTDDTVLGIHPTTFVISVTNLQATYYADQTVFEWLKRYTPAKIIGHSLFVYDFSGNPEAIESLRRLRS